MDVYSWSKSCDEWILKIIAGGEYMSKTMASGLILVYFLFKGPGDCCG